MSNNNSKNYVLSGLNELIILAVLIKEDSYVYDIAKEIEKRSNGNIHIPMNTVYSVTYRLNEEGKISQYPKLVGKRRERMYCHLENEGRKYYQQLLESFKVIFSGIEQITNTLFGDN